jgi:hypothetical protein
VSKKKKKKAPPARAAAVRSNVESESRQAVALTVAWMLATLSGTVASIAWMIAAGITLYFKPPGQPSKIAMIPNTLLFIAGAAGVLNLVLMPAAYRWRAVPPPRAIAVYAVCVAVFPLVGMLVLKLVERLALQ